MRLTTLVVLFLGGFPLGRANAQPPDSLWLKTYPELSIAHSVIRIGDECAFCGTTSESGSSDACIALVDGAGNMLWHAFSGLPGGDHAYSLTIDGSGGFLATGYAYVSSGTNVLQMLVSGDGSLQWADHFGGNGNQYSLSHVRSNSAGYVIVGPSQSDEGPDYDVGLWVIGDDGTLEYERKWIASSYDDSAVSICTTSDDGYAIAGYKGTTPYYQNAHCMLVKVSSHYNRSWTKTYGTGHLSEVGQAADGGFFLCGDAGTSSNTLIRTDANGNAVWQNFYPRNGSSFCDLMPTTDGGCVVLGDSAGDFLLFEVDSAGTRKWTATYGSSVAEQATSFDMMSDGGLIIAGVSTTAEDALLLRLGPFVSVEEDYESVPQCSFGIGLVTPNPMTGTCSITLDPGRAPAELNIYDIAGRSVRTWDISPDGGPRSILWDGSSTSLEPLPAGIYMLSLRSGNLQDNMEIVILR